jgi:hypothetical protein
LKSVVWSQSCWSSSRSVPIVQLMFNRSVWSMSSGSVIVQDIIPLPTVMNESVPPLHAMKHSISHVVCFKCCHCTIQRILNKFRSLKIWSLLESFESALVSKYLSLPHYEYSRVGKAKLLMLTTSLGNDHQMITTDFNWNILIVTISPISIRYFKFFDIAIFDYSIFQVFRLFDYFDISSIIIRLFDISSISIFDYSIFQVFPLSIIRYFKYRLYRFALFRYPYHFEDHY